MVRRVGGKMKKTLIISCILSILITFGGCVISTDLYSGKRPYDYGEATWFCKEIDARFVVNAPEDGET